MKKVLKRWVWIGACLGLMVGSARGAEIEVGQVVVTATRTEVEISESPQSISVITREEIKGMPDQTIAEIMQRVPGVEIVQNGTRGGVAYVHIRGSEAEQVLVLINGRRVNDAQGGRFDLSNLPVNKDEIERIEVLRGAASALYGADAMGGVINIITKAPSRKPETRASASLGRFGTQLYSLDHRWKPGALGYSFSFSREESRGYRENSDYGAWVLGGEVSYELAPQSEVKFSVRNLQKKLGLPGTVAMPDPDNREEDSLTQLDLSYKGKIASSFDLMVRGFQNIYRRTYDPQTQGLNVGLPFLHKNYATGGEVQTTTALGTHLLTAGLETIQDRVDSTADGIHQATRGGLYLQDEIELAKPLTAALGLRYDLHSLYQNQLNPRAGLVLKLPGESVLRASASRSYRAPTFDDLYWPEDAYTAGNPNLQPEKAWSYELGGEKRFGGLALLKVAGFYRDVQDLIRWAEGTDGKWRPGNVQSADIWGAEAELTFYPLKGLAIPINYSFLYPRDEKTGGPIFNKPKHIINAGLEITTKFGLKSSLKGRYVQVYLDKPSTLNQDYFVLDARVAYEFKVDAAFNGEVFIGMTNALNRDYQVNEGYPMPPQSVNGGISLAF